LNNAVTCSSSLNIVGRTILGTGYNYSDSVLGVHKNLIIRPNIAGSGEGLAILCCTNPSYLVVEQGNNITLKTRNSVTSNAMITLDTTLVNITGSLTCANFGTKSPIFFTTNRNMTINGYIYSVYDIDLTKYTKIVTLDTYDIRQFRIRLWPSDADFEYSSQYFSEMYLKRYDIFMSNKYGLTIYSLSAPFENYYLRETFGSHFLYRNSFNYPTFCSRNGVQKIYCIIEDLL
jgi:hypothetical protein